MNESKSGARRGGEARAGREKGGRERRGLVEWEAKAATIPCNLQRQKPRGRKRSPTSCWMQNFSLVVTGAPQPD